MSRAVVRRCGGKTCPPGTCDHGKKARSHPPLTRAAAAVETVLRSPGQPLDRSTRGVMEARFAHDFADVRVHTDSRAGESARLIDADAYAFRRDVVFAPGRYRPGTRDGDRLLAHELAHVVQQRGATGTPGQIELGNPHDGAETEAAAVAEHAVAAPSLRRAHVQRQVVAPPAPEGSSAGVVEGEPSTAAAAAAPFQICARDLQGALGYVGNHAYVEAPPHRYSIIGPFCPANRTDNLLLGTTAKKWDNSPDPCGKTPACVPCTPADGVTDVGACLRTAFDAYNDPSLYMGLGPNSNTFAGTLARTCCAGMVPQPSALGNCPGWSHDPAPARASGEECATAPQCT